MLALLLLLLVPVALSVGAYKWSASNKERQTRNALKPSNRQKKVQDKGQAIRLPYRYADDLMFITGDSVWTGVKLSGTTDEYLTGEEKGDAAAGVANTYNALLAVFDGQSVHCHEQIRYRPSSADAWERAYLRALWNPTKLFRALIQQVSGLLAESTPERQRFLMVRLGDFNATSVLDPLNSIATLVSGVADEHFRKSDLDPFRERAIRVHLQLAAFRATPMTRGDLIWLIRKVLSGHRFPEEQPILSSKPVRNGYFDMALNFHGRNGHDYVEIIDADPDTGETRSSYTTTLVVGHSAPLLEFNPALSWGPLLAQHIRPVELSWRYELISAAQFKKRAVEAAENVQDEARDREKGRASRDPFFDSKLERADELYEDAGRNPQPAMLGLLRLVLSAPSPRELALAEQEVRNTMTDSSIEMVRVPRAQYLLLQEQLPGDYTGKVFGGLIAAQGGGVAIGERTTDIWAPAVARLDSDDRVGDRVESWKGRPRGWRGFPIGYSYRKGSPTHFSLHVQTSRDRGAGVAIIGGSGGGKSTLALLLYFWESESGTQCMALDPKNDFEKFVYYIAFGEQVLHPDFAKEAEAGTLGTEHSQFQPVNRQFWADTAIVNLTRGIAGQLDAWSVCGSYAKAEALARGQIEVLFQNPDERAIVERGLVAMREHWEKQQAGQIPESEHISPCLGAVKYFIQQSRAKYETMVAEKSDAFQATRELERIDTVVDRFTRAADTQYAKLMIGTGQSVSLGDMSRRRVIFTLHGFTPPTQPDDPTSWSEAERNAAACMFTAMTIVHGLFDDRMKQHPVTGKQAVPPRALFVDEGYMIARQPKGQALLSKGLRQGRSLNLVIVFISQQPRDIQELEQQAKEAGETDSNQFGTVFVFRQKSREESIAALRLLRDTNSDASREVVELARQLREVGPAGGLLKGGRCAMRDVDGRVATVSIDQMFQELARATETNPQDRPKVQCEPISGDGAEWELDFSTMFSVRTGILEAEEYANMLGDDGIEFDDEWREFIERNEAALDDSNRRAFPELHDDTESQMS